MSSIGIKENCRSKVTTPVSSLSNAFSLQKGKNGRSFPKLLSVFQKLQHKGVCSVDQSKNSICNTRCNNGEHSTDSNTETLTSKVPVSEMKNTSNKSSLIEDSVISKNIHPPIQNMHTNSNPTYIFIDNKVTVSYEDINNITGNCEQSGTKVKQIENIKTVKKAPPVPPLPSALKCKKNQEIALNSATSFTKISYSHFQCDTSKNIASNETSAMDKQKNSSRNIIINQSDNKNVGKPLSKTNRQTSRPVKRPAPKPPKLPSTNQSLKPNDSYENTFSSAKHSEIQTSDQIEDIRKNENCPETNKEDEVVCFASMTDEYAEKCPSVSTAPDSLPELPAKTVPHDTKVLFGYSADEKMSARKLHLETEHNNSSSGKEDNNVSVIKALPQHTQYVGGRAAVALGKSTTSNQITSRDMFYKSLSLHRCKKPNFKKIRESAQIGKDNHDHILSITVENTAGMLPCSKSSHDAVEMKLRSVAVSVDSPDVMTTSFAKSTDSLNCVQGSQDRCSILQHPPKTTILQEFNSVPLINEKCKTKNSCTTTYQDCMNKFSEERISHDNSVLGALSNSTSYTSPQTTSDLKQYESLDCADHITSTKDSALNKNGTKHDIIKETENTSMDNSATEVASPALERVDKNDSDVESAAKDSIEHEIKCSQLHTKQLVSEINLDCSFMKVVENGKKEAEQYINDSLESASQINANVNDLKCANIAQTNSKETGTEQKNVAKSNITVTEKCHELHNTAFSECHSDAEITSTLLETDERKISVFQILSGDKLPSQQNKLAVVNSFSAVSTDRMKGLCFAKEKSSTGMKLRQSELHPFSSKCDSLHISNKLGVSSQNRNNKICPTAKSARLLQETSALTSSQQTSTTSEVSTFCKLGPSKIYNQAIFLPSGTMSSHQLNITMLFRQLEAAIANGHHKRAAILARELALHKVVCTLSSFNVHEHSPKEKPITINLYVEDKDLHQGPFPLLVHCTMTLGALKSKLEKEFALPKKLQRWILGKRLATDDDTTLQDYGVNETGCSVFLYLICDDSDENQNNLLEKLSKIPKNVSPIQKLHNLDDPDLHNGRNYAHLCEEMMFDIENIGENNVSEDEYVSNSDDDYLINSGLPPLNDTGSSTGDLEVGNTENQRHSSASHSDSEEAETDVKSINDDLSSSDFVMITDNYLEKENEMLNYEQSDDEVDLHLTNIHKINETNSVVTHLIEESVCSHLRENEQSGITRNNIKMQNTDASNNEVTDFIEENVHNHLIETPVSSASPIFDAVANTENETGKFSSASHIPNKNEKDELGESLSNSTCDENAVHNKSTDTQEVPKENKVYFSASSSKVNEDPNSQLNDSLKIAVDADEGQRTKLVNHAEIKSEELFGYQLLETEYSAMKNEFGNKIESVEHLKRENEVKFAPDTTYILPTAKQKVEDLHNREYLYTKNSNMQEPKACILEEEKLEQNAAEKEEVEIEQEQRGYLPDMEYVAVINELSTETAEEEQKQNQVEQYHFVNYAIPTAIELTEQKLKDVHHAQAIEIWVPMTSVVHSSNTENKLEQNNTGACASHGSSYALLEDKCESETNTENAVNTANTVESAMVQDSSSDNKEISSYQYLMQLDNQDLVPNAEPFWCPVCFTDIQERQGVVLRDCLHQFCKECLAGSVEHALTTIIKCPFRNEEYSCESCLQEREIKAVVTAEVFERYLRRGMMAAEGRADNSFHCKMPDCPGWCILDNPASTFKCPTCSHINCLWCQAVHEDLTCQQYQEELEYQFARNAEVQETKNYLDNMVKEGKAMLCPKCDAFVIKRWGCDWLKCSVCQTEICWITKKARWGPGGHGDTSDGCKCGVNGQRCHPKCNYCH